MDRISDSVIFLGVNDKTLDLFESQYAVPNGISYNSYLIKDKCIAIFDTVDKRKADEWFLKLEEALNGKVPDCLIISHLEPDHSGCIASLISRFPDIKLVGNDRTFKILTQFFDVDLNGRVLVVKENDTLCLGKHNLQFLMAPMIHWPEVMVTFDADDRILFSADAFGKFGTLDVADNWLDEGRRYYVNICGKYGLQVQSLLCKLKQLPIKTICPLHGPVLSDNLPFYFDKYDIWSSYRTESDGILILYASIHGNTRDFAVKLASMLTEKIKVCVEIRDLSRSDLSEAVGKAFQYGKMILACSTYDGALFPVMEEFLNHLKSKNYQKKMVGLVENGTWSSQSAKLMTMKLNEMKDISVCKQIVSIKSVMKQENLYEMENLINEIILNEKK